MGEPDGAAQDDTAHRGSVKKQSGCRRYLRPLFEWGYLVGILLLLLLGRLLEPVPVWILVPTTFLFYLLLPPVPVAVYALIRRRLLRHLPVLILLLFFLLLFGRQLLPSRTAPPGKGITVMTYNIHREETGSNAFLPVIRQWQPDVLALQEAIQPRAQRDDLVSTLDDQLGFDCTYRAYYQRPGSAGIAVCVAPTIRLHNVQRRTYHARGKWSYLFAEMMVGDRNVNIVVPHLLAFGISGSDPISDPRYTTRRLRWASRWHHRETNELLRLIGLFKDPTIMAGDFNSTPNQAIHARIRRSLRDTFQHKGFGLGATHRFLLPIRIDYIYVNPDFEVLSADVGPRGPSDHGPVIARIRLR